MWTKFTDTFSGGNSKTPYKEIFIEASLETSKSVFIERIGRNPFHVTCACCGPDYAEWEDEDIVDVVSPYKLRNMSLTQYLAQDDVLVLRRGETQKGEVFWA